MSLQRKAHPFCLLPRLAAILAGLFLAESPGQQAREEKLAGRDESTRGSWCMSVRLLLSVLALQIWVPRSKQPKRRRVFLKDSRSESTLRVQNRRVQRLTLPAAWAWVNRGLQDGGPCFQLLRLYAEHHAQA